MTRDPAYPDDIPVGSPVGSRDSAKAPLAAEKPSKEDPEETKSEDSGRGRRIATGAAIGIGSAALVAALLYATHARKKDPPSND